MIKRGKANKKVGIFAYLMIAPTILGLIILNIIPFIETIRLSFFKTGAFGKNSWAGFDNYIKFINDSEIFLATKNTILYMLLSVPICILLALILASLLNTKIKFRGLYRAIYFLPMVVAPAATSMVWKWLFNADAGIINQLFNLNINWLTDPNIAIVSIAIVTIWSSLGYNIVLLLAGLQSISKSYYEASIIDGATGIKQFFHITIPLISPTLFFVVILQVMNALKQFDFIYLLIGKDNPALESTKTLTYLFYEYAFIIRDKGYASIIILWSFIIIAIISIIQFKVQKKWVHYD